MSRDIPSGISREQKINNGLHTLFTGRQLTLLETVNSTNSFMNNLLLHHRLPEGAAVVAGEQSAGRGLAHERWISDGGKNLLMTILFYPAFLSIHHLFLLSKTFSLGIYDGIAELVNNEVKIKWPNDIYYRDKKLGGILIENSIRHITLNHSLFGLGLNVNQEIFPPELPNPVSLKMILGKQIAVDDCFSMLCNTLERRYLQLKAGHVNKINEDYIKAMYRFGEFHEYENRIEKFTAKISSVADDGKLILTRKNGPTEKYDLKEVKFVL